MGKKLNKVQAPIQRGAYVNAKDEDGRTSLMRVNVIEIAKLLIERGGDVKAEDDDEEDF